MNHGDEFSDVDETLRYFAGGPRCNWTGKVFIHSIAQIPLVASRRDTDTTRLLSRRDVYTLYLRPFCPSINQSIKLFHSEPKS